MGLCVLRLHGGGGAEQRADRGYLSLRCVVRFRVDDRWLAAVVADAPGYRDGRFSDHRRPVARAGHLAQRKILLVLFRQRTFPALSGQASSGRLRHRADRLVLDAAPGLAVSVQRLSAAGVPAPARSAAAQGTRRSVAALRLAVGAGGDRLLLLLDPPGVLHLPGLSGAGAAGRGGTGPGRDGGTSLGGGGTGAAGGFWGRCRRGARLPAVDLTPCHARGGHLAGAHAQPG